jgi:hypothetical protein
MDELSLKLSFLEKRIERIEEKLNQIPIPFKLMYRPPETEHHVNVVQYLDEIDKRLKELENGNSVHG